MKYAILIGSHRPDSQSTKVGRYVEARIKNRDEGAETYVLDMRKNPLPLWQETYWEKGSDLQQEVNPHVDPIKDCDAIVVVAPEWSGMVPAGLKNLFLYLSPEHVGHKPGLIVTVSAGTGGSYPVNELRISSYKNTRICYIPDHVIVTHVNDRLNNHSVEGENDKDDYIKRRIEFSLDSLDAYSSAMTTMRKNTDNLFDEDFPYGM